MMLFEPALMTMLLELVFVVAPLTVMTPPLRLLVILTVPPITLPEAPSVIEPIEEATLGLEMIVPIEPVPIVTVPPIVFRLRPLRIPLRLLSMTVELVGDETFT